SYSEVLMLACGFLLFLAFYEFGSLAMASTPFGDRCAEFGDPISCSIISNVKLLELLFWPAILTPTLTLFGTALALRQFARGTSSSSTSGLYSHGVENLKPVAPRLDSRRPALTISRRIVLLLLHHNQTSARYTMIETR